MTGVLGSTIVATAALADTIRIFWGMSLLWFFGISLYVGIILDNQSQEKANKKNLTVEAVRMYHRPKTQIDKLAVISGLIIVVDLSSRYAVRSIAVFRILDLILAIWFFAAIHEYRKGRL